MAKPSVCVGSGLVALDVILNGSPNSLSMLSAGGSCGNVLAILASMGWSSKPIARLGKDKASEFLIKDLSEFNVKGDLLSQTDDGSTPIIIHRILKDKSGNPKHRFEFRNPEDGSWLPRYKPVLASKVEEIKIGKPDAFYFDRINRGTIELALKSKKENAVIIFEPSSIGEMRLFKECLNVADIIKFSGERISDYDKVFAGQQVMLEIRTLGASGCEFRFSKTKGVIKWEKLPAFTNVSQYVIDSAGAGDWCTAGIISELCKEGHSSFLHRTKDDVVKAITIGQAYGALNCCFNGARGLMYKTEKSTLDKLISYIITNKQKNLGNVLTDAKRFRDEVKIKISISGLYSQE